MEPPLALTLLGIGLAWACGAISASVWLARLGESHADTKQIAGGRWHPFRDAELKSANEAKTPSEDARLGRDRVRADAFR